MSSGQCKTRISENAIYFTSHHWIVYHSSVDWRNYVLFLWMSSWAMKATPQTIAVPFVFSRRNYCLGHEMIAFLIQLKHVMVFTTYKNRLPPFPVVSVKADQEFQCSVLRSSIWLPAYWSWQIFLLHFTGKASSSSGYLSADN